MIAVGSQYALDQLRGVIEAAPAAFVAVDRDGFVTLWNGAAENLFGWSASEVLGRPDPTLRPRDRTTGGGPGPEVVRRRRDGRLLELTVVSRPLGVPDAADAGRLSVYTEVAERRRLELELAVRARQQAAVVALGEVALSSSPTPVVLAAAAQTVADTLGLPAVALLRTAPAGRPRTPGDGWGFVAAAVHTADRTADRARPAPWTVGEPLRPGVPGLETATRALAGRTSVVADVAHLPADEAAPLAAAGLGSVAAVVVGKPTDPWGVLLATSRTPGAFGRDDVWFLQSVGTVVAAADARRTAEAEVRHRACHDGLTGLPNRTLLRDRLVEQLDDGRRERRATALLLLDLDGFKDVNDSHGHQAGDHVLVQVADRIRVVLGARGVVGRLGGDEFAVLLGGLDDPQQARVVAVGLLCALEAPFGTPGGPVRIGGSIGVSLAPDHGDDPTTLLMHADLAMYRAKRERLGHAVFDPGRDRDPSERLALVAELHTAIGDGGVRVEYQPTVAPGTHELWGAESLVRWTSRRLGPQSPAEFVALAERAGLIEELTEFVLRAAAAQAARWRDAGRRLAVSVNVSPVALSAPDLPGLVRSCTAAHGLRPDELRLEVTESTLANDRAVEALNRLTAQGVRVALDDFGTGYSSLARLKHLPVCALKVDRSFVRGIGRDPRDTAILRTVMTLARELDLTVVAEGIETTVAARAVTDLGVHLAQGLLYAPAMAAADFDAWARRWAAGDRPCCAAERALVST